jgi:hypothetical protein
MVRRFSSRMRASARASASPSTSVVPQSFRSDPIPPPIQFPSVRLPPSIRCPLIQSHVRRRAPPSVDRRAPPFAVLPSLPRHLLPSSLCRPSRAEDPRQPIRASALQSHPMIHPLRRPGFPAGLSIEGRRNGGNLIPHESCGLFVRPCDPARGTSSLMPSLCNTLPPTLPVAAVSSSACRCQEIQQVALPLIVQVPLLISHSSAS